MVARHFSPSTVVGVALVLAAGSLVVFSRPARRPSPAGFDQRAAAPPAAHRGTRLTVSALLQSRPRRRPSPTTVVAAYYAALDAHRFAGAWKVLSPAVRARFGGFAAWRAGYAATLHSRPGAPVVRRTAEGAVVTHALSAADRRPCGTLRRTFSVTWRLVRAPGGWRAAGLTAVPGSAPARCERSR